jgi:hypothetical protein
MAPFTAPSRKPTTTNASTLIAESPPQPAPLTRLDVAIVIQRTPVASPWADARWEPVAVEVVAPGTAPGWTRLAEPARGPRWRFTGLALELHRSEAEGYHLNLTAPAPMVFVLWRMLEPEALEEGGPAARPDLATVSYNEAARLLDGGEQVDGIPMPAAIRAWLEPFTALHYKPEPKRKVRRRDPLRDDVSPQTGAQSPAAGAEPCRWE